ncbi:MAG TPA: SDR family NAD(P)-dependent oxidoreductase [Actinomycetes bacterium]|nr:SDR family NAD(P)-dependent oxidoreductase [Actinomycetes bacterium]
MRRSHADRPWVANPTGGRPWPTIVTKGAWLTCWASGPKGAARAAPRRASLDITATVASIREAGGKAWGLRCDVADLDQVHGTVAAVERDHGRLDLLTTCAAIAPVAPVAELDPHALQRVVGVNLLGTMWCAQAVLPLMRRQHAGTIVTFSSHSARLPLPRAAAYCATKAGVAAFTEALYTEVHRDGIDVLTVYPAVVPDTDPGPRRHRPARHSSQMGHAHGRRRLLRGPARARVRPHTGGVASRIDRRARHPSPCPDLDVAPARQDHPVTGAARPSGHD